MGQRSQIYVRFPMKKNGKEGYGLIANYYQWNFGERMISRCRYAIEYIRDAHILDYIDWYFSDTHYYEHFKRYLDVNYDMKDLVLSTDIIEEYKEFYDTVDEVNMTLDSKFNDFVFDGQDNNDGKMLIDISKSGIKYAFLRWQANETETMDAEEYMEWDCGVDWKHQDSDYVSTCIQNINEISGMAALMTEDEVREFLNCKYVNEPVILDCLNVD